jgi:UTP--glucose-1-phosphate uridylyltransferase
MTAYSRIHRAVIPAAGLGTRLRPLTRAFPKELLPIGRKPVLAHIAAELHAAGITEVLFVVSERKPQIRDYFGESYAGEEGENWETPLRCDYVTQTQQRGSGDAVLYAQDWVGNAPFLAVFGDCLMDAPEPAAPLRRVLATHREQQAAATVLVETVPWEKVARYGVLAPAQPLDAPTAPFAAADIVEKPAPQDAPSNLVVAARWALQPAIFAFLRRLEPDTRGEFSLTDAVRALCREQGPLWGVPLLPGEARRDIGSMESFFTAFVRAALRDSDYGNIVRRVLVQEFREPEERR